MVSTAPSASLNPALPPAKEHENGGWNAFTISIFVIAVVLCLSCYFLDGFNKIIFLIIIKNIYWSI